MNTKKKTIKSILCCTTACSALAMAGIGAININNPKYEVFATGTNSIPVSISNANFNSNTKTSYPYSPSNFNAYNQGIKVESSSNVSANINAGVINLSNEKYETKFSQAKRNSLDDYVLMIDSSTEKDGKTTMHNANYGFQTSSSIKMDADSKYMFTVDVFTATNANIASLYLFDNAGEEISSIKNINSYNNWTTYTFFVSTNSSQNLEAKIGMYLEGAGVVLFDNISGFKLSENEYNFTKENTISGTFKENDNTSYVKKYTINNNKFENVADNSDFASLTNTSYDPESQSSLTVVNHSDGANDKALLLENKDETYSLYETQENFLTFEQNNVYKVSVSVKTENLDGPATISLIRADVDENDDNYSTDYDKTIEITSSTVSKELSVTNDFKTYSFLINSHSSQSVSYKFAFGLGKDSSNKAKGKMYLSEIEVSNITYDTFDSAKTGSGTEKINFVDAYKDSKIMLNNGDFNAFKIADIETPRPATPVDWDVKVGNNTQKYGVVNTLTFEDDLANISFSNLKNPSNGQNNNVLMMYNETADTLSYTSKTKNLSAKTYHKFEVKVQTQNAPLKISLVTKKDDAEVELASKIVNTNYSWQNATMYLYTGYQAMDVSLKLTLDTTSYGYAYIDDAKFDYLLTTAQLEEEFNNAENADLTSKTNLSKMLGENAVENFSNSTLFTSENVSGVENGIITLNSAHLDEVIYDTDNLETFNSINGNVYGIRATDDVHYSVKSNVGFRMTTGSDVYYKISVSVYTQNISTNDSEVDLSKVGASIKLSGFDDTFTSIKSENEWTTYTFYIQAESDTTTYLEIALGNENVKAKGDVFFGNIEFKDDVTADEYNAIKNSETIKKVKAETKTTEDDTTSDEKDNKISKTTWIYLIPSLLTALAILIAVVGFAIRKIKFKKPRKKTKNAYDRNKTVSVQYYTRKATTIREAKIRELSADLEKINAERKKFEEDYKHDLTKLREMKIKRANPSEIAKLEKDLKKNQKLSANLGLTANKISNELSYAKTDAYLNNLIKKLEREQPASNKDSENKD